MAFPTLTPTSQQSAIVLPPTGTAGDVLPSLPFGIYTTGSFISGAVDQVAYTYRKLGGDILDLEIKAENVYANYEDFQQHLIPHSNHRISTLLAETYRTHHE